MSSRRIFEKFDRNNDGKLSSDEFYEATLAFFNIFPHGEILAMFRGMDVHGDGEVDVDKFTSRIEKILKYMFDFCDVDGDGKIPADELYVSMNKLGKEWTEESCAEIVKIADADGDGYLSFEEFMAMVFIEF